jgi:hypothetical protein
MKFNTDLEIITRALDNFYDLSLSGDGPVIQQPPLSELIADMELSSLVRDG